VTIDIPVAFLHADNEDYLIMKMVRTLPVRINICDYEFPKEILGVCMTPASDHLFKVHEDRRKLNEELADDFHHTVYQLLFAANRERHDIQTAVHSSLLE